MGCDILAPLYHGWFSVSGTRSHAVNIKRLTSPIDRKTYLKFLHFYCRTSPDRTIRLSINTLDMKDFSTKSAK